MLAATMTPTQFYHELDQLMSGESRIIFMERLHAAHYRFDLESQPDAIIRRFYYNTTPAQEVAEVFALCFTTPIMCRAATFCAKKPMTLLDCMSNDLDEYEDSPAIERIIELMDAIHSSGTLNAEWHCANDLKQAYLLDPLYQNTLAETWGFASMAELDAELDADSDLDAAPRIGNSFDLSEPDAEQEWTFRDSLSESSQEVGAQDHISEAESEEVPSEAWAFYEDLVVDDSGYGSDSSDSSDLDTDARILPIAMHLTHILN